jgi:hypothetical protein
MHSIMTTATPEMRANYELECLRSALRALENLVLRAYLSTRGTAYHDLRGGITACQTTARACIRMADKCPDGSQPTNGMCEFPSGSGNWVKIDDAWEMEMTN